jgi:hypothetical protein
LHGQALTEEDRYALIESRSRRRNEGGATLSPGRVGLSWRKEEREAEIPQSLSARATRRRRSRALVAGLIAMHGKEFRAIMPLAAKEDERAR